MLFGLFSNIRVFHVDIHFLYVYMYTFTCTRTCNWHALQVLNIVLHYSQATFIVKGFRSFHFVVCQAPTALGLSGSFPGACLLATCFCVRSSRPSLNFLRLHRISNNVAATIAGSMQTTVAMTSLRHDECEADRANPD